MSSSNNLLKATLNSLGTRLEKTIKELSSVIEKLAKNTPERLNNEWESFQKEVLEEAERLNKQESSKDSERPQDPNPIGFDSEVED